MPKVMKDKLNRNFVPASIRNVDEEEKTITHTISTISIDRYGTAVVPRGGQFRHFMANPVVLWLHNLDSEGAKIPIAKCTDLEIRDKEIVATTKFNPNDKLSMRVFEAYRDGFLHAWSIGFMPKKLKRIDHENMEDINEKYGLEVTEEQIEGAEPFGLYLIFEWELFEYSAVPVPGNPEALNNKGVKQFEQGLIRRGLMSDENAIRVNFSKIFDRYSDKRDAEDADEKEDVKEESEVEDSEATEEVEEEDTPEEEVEEEASEEDEESEVEEDSDADSESEEEDEEHEDDCECEECVDYEEEEEHVEGCKCEDCLAESEEEDEEVEDDEEDSEEVEDEESDEDEDVDEEEEEVDEDEDDEVSERLQSFEEEVDSLKAKNKKLSKRVRKLEKTIEEKLEILEDVKKTLDVDNVKNVRKVLQKRAESKASPDTFFSDFLRSK